MRRVSAPGFLLAVALVSHSGAARAGSAACDLPTMPPVVRVHVLEQQVTYDFTKDTAEIRAVAAGQPAAHDGEAVVVRGLTAAHFSWRADISSARYPGRGGGSCAYPSELDLTIGYDQPTVVYVERDFPVGSCQHDAILEHEENHVRIHRESLASHLPLIRSAAEAAMADPEFPLFDQDPGAVVSAAVARVEKAIRAEVDSLDVDRQGRHAYLDRSESIAATQARCASW